MLNNVSKYEEKNIRDIYLNLEPYDLKLGTKFYIAKNLDCFLKKSNCTDSPGLNLKRKRRRERELEPVGSLEPSKVT
jgi:hypothetical protein